MSPITGMVSAAVAPPVLSVSVVLIVKLFKAVSSPIAPLRVSDPEPLNIVRLSVPLPSPSIVVLNVIVPSLLSLSELTVTEPLISTAPVNEILGLAVSAVLILDPSRVIPSAPVIATLRISSAVASPISPIVTVSVAESPPPP